MRRNAIVIAVVSVIVGAFMATMLPVQAHHSDRRMKARILSLEIELSNLEGFIVDCLYTQGVSQYNDYRSVSGGQVTALDLDTSTAPRFLMVGLEPSCAGAFKVSPGKTGAAKLRR